MDDHHFCNFLFSTYPTAISFLEEWIEKQPTPPPFNPYQYLFSPVLRLSNTRAFPLE